MLPTAGGWLVGLTLAAMLLIGVNYNNGLALALTFLLAAIGFVGMLFTHRNLAALEISGSDRGPVFAGDTATFLLRVRNPTPRPRYAVCASRSGRALACCSPPANGEELLEVPVATSERGWLAMPALVLASQYPMGLLFTWSRVIRPPRRVLVYPQPGPALPLQPALDRGAHQQSGRAPEGDDFLGLRPWRRGDSPGRVHWRTAARGLELQTKLFGGAAAETLWLDFGAWPSLPVEDRLRVLCRWVVDSEHGGFRYGLRLPGQQLAPDRGEAHYRRCLAALALFND
jgi:uncharacterized protein (DUF58 family)